MCVPNAISLEQQRGQVSSHSFDLKSIGTGNLNMDQVNMWKQDFFSLFIVHVPCSDRASGLPVRYGRHYVDCQVLSFVLKKAFLFLEKISASTCLIISMSPVLKLTFKYLGENPGSWWWHRINDCLMLERKLPWNRVLVFYTQWHRATVMSRQRVCQWCVLACAYPQLQLSFSYCPHLCRLAVQRPWPVQNLFSQAHV